MKNYEKIDYVAETLYGAPTATLEKLIKNLEDLNIICCGNYAIDKKLRDVFLNEYRKIVDFNLLIDTIYSIYNGRIYKGRI